MDASYGLEKICLDITHTFVGDLTIWLRSPQGTEVLLTDQNGGGGQNYTVTCFDGVSGTSITSGSAPFNGSFLPEEPLGLFNSGTENPNGSWVLKVQDQFPGDVGTLQSFSLTFSNMPAMVAGAQNNDCSSSQMVTVNQSYTCTILENVTLSGATASGTPESCAFPANTFDDDIWFVFTASTSDQEVRITNEQGSPADLVFEVLEGSCGSLTSLLCHDDPDIGAEIGDLTAGNSYYLRIASKSSGLNTTFDLCIKEAIPDPPSNDDCAGAIEVSTSSCIPVAGTVAGATFSGPGVSCPFTIVGNFNDDVWYAFQPTESSHEFNVTNVQGTSTALDYQILSSSGSCSNLSEIFCHSESGSTHKFIVGGLNIGAQYYLRVATFQTTAQNTKFDICINPLGASSNPHDECSSAGSIPISNGLSCTSTITGTLLDATPSAEAQACSATIAPFNDDVWFSFTAVQDTYDLKVSNITGQAPDLIFEVLSGNSCASLTSILCHDDPDELVGLSGLTQGQQYFVRIASYSTSPQTTSFDLCLTDNTPPPANDECAGAIEIIPSAGATCTSSQNGTLAAATASSVPQTCPFTGTAPFDDDVWFFFTATETSHQIDVTNISGSTTDLIYEIFSGSCGSLSSIRCHDDPNSEIILSNLVVNDPYFIRVASYPTTGQTTTFSICVKSAPTPPANDECTGATT
ncbi:MAG: proprotein convertase P-domain-containing protein, partial [Saprospiraceae bacterium]|nr:proprotein convertase P-domain-containing protein [Saprospiraceae bacterium]